MFGVCKTPSPRKNGGRGSRPSVPNLLPQLLPNGTSPSSGTALPPPQPPTLTNPTGPTETRGRSRKDRRRLQPHGWPSRPRAGPHPSLSIPAHSFSGKCPGQKTHWLGFLEWRLVWSSCLEMGTKRPTSSPSGGLWEVLQEDKAFACLFLSYQFSYSLEAKSPLKPKKDVDGVLL